MQKALFTLLISFPLLLEAGGNFSQEKALPSYEGTFALIEDQIPQYVGYKQNDSSNVIQEIEDAFALELKPKDLIFKFEGAVQTPENSQDFPRQKQKYTNLT